MNELRIWAFVMLIAWSSISVSASFSGGSGLSGALTLDTDFADAIAALGIDLPPGDYYAGVGFSEFHLGPSIFGGTGIRSLISPISDIHSAIIFSTPMASIAMNIRDTVATRLTISLDGTTVESFETVGGGYDTPIFYGFFGVLFDRIDFTHDLSPVELNDRIFGIDRLQSATVPLPPPIVLFLSCVMSVPIIQTFCRGAGRDLELAT